MRKRSRRARKPETPARSRTASSLATGNSDLLASIEPCGLYEQDQHRDGIDGEASRVGEQIFASSIANAEDESAGQCAPHAAGAADRNDQQEKHQINDSEARRQSKELDGKATAKRGQSTADGKCEREQTIDINADRLRHASVVDRGADFSADTGALEAVPKRRNQRGADHD